MTLNKIDGLLIMAITSVAIISGILPGLYFFYLANVVDHHPMAIIAIWTTSLILINFVGIFVFGLYGYLFGSDSAGVPDETKETENKV